MRTTSHTSQPPELPQDVLSHPTRDDRRVDLDGRVTLHFLDLEGPVTERTQNVSATGMFVRTPALRPPGTFVRFELDLANGLESIVGQAEVAWIRRHDDGLFRPAGMGLRFLGLDKESQDLIRWSVANRTRELRKILHLDAVEAEPAPASDPDVPRSEVENPSGDAAGVRPLQGRKWGESSALAELRAEVDLALKDALETSSGRRVEGAARVEPLRVATQGEVDTDPTTPLQDAERATVSPRGRVNTRLWRLASLPLVALAALGLYLLSPVSEPVSATPQATTAAAQAIAQLLPAEPPELVPLGLGPAQTVPTLSDAETATESVAADLEQLTQDWAEAWSQQRARTYLTFYAPGFQPPGGLDRAAWERQREERILKPRHISVEVSDLETEVLSPERARVRFAQTYRSDRYRDTVRKTFGLVRGEQGWQILTESSEPAS